MSLLTCTVLLSALGGCHGAESADPPPLLRASIQPSAAPRAGPTPRAQAVWPLSPDPPIRRPFEAPPQPWAAGHRGVDLLATSGQTVRAASAGRVTFSGVVAGRGVVSVEHANGWRTTYQPLTDRVPVGTVVSPGTTIGRLSATGSHCAPDACLHWGLLVAPDQYRDPLTLLGVRRQIVLLPLR